MVRIVLNFLHYGILDNNLGEIFIILISKVDVPESFAQFRLISLCHISYKAITKVLFNTMQMVLSYLVSTSHSSFIPRRQLHDNVVILREMAHSMYNRRLSPGWMVMKIDLQKAYDRVQWDFLLDCLRLICFLLALRERIKTCLQSCSMRVAWNEKCIEDLQEGCVRGTPYHHHFLYLLWSI